MEIVFYIIIFMIGAALGSIYANIIQRILKNKKVLSMHSYCENCGKRLRIIEKIPIFSYIFLKGKCRKCNKKINSKYIILEILMAFIFILIAKGMKLSIYNVSIENLISFIFINLYISYIIFAINFDKQERNIPITVIAYGIIISIIYILYLCIVESVTIYRNIIYLVILVVTLLINIINIKKRAQDSYLINLLITILITLIFTEKIVCLLTLMGTLISVATYILISKFRKRRIKKVESSSKINIIFMFGILNLIVFLALINICK